MCNYVWNYDVYLYSISIRVFQARALVHTGIYRTFLAYSSHIMVYTNLVHMYRVRVSSFFLSFIEDAASRFRGVEQAKDL